MLKPTHSHPSLWDCPLFCIMPATGCSISDNPMFRELYLWVGQRLRLCCSHCVRLLIRLLSAIHHVVIAIPHRFGLYGLNVTPGVRLGNADTTDAFHQRPSQDRSRSFCPWVSVGGHHVGHYKVGRLRDATRGSSSPQSSSMTSA